MGTSSAYSGAGSNTPLLPTWADSPLKPSPDQINDLPQNSIEIVTIDDRFQGARTSFSRYVTSNGTDVKALKRSVNQYIANSLGGVKGAAQRMAGSGIAVGQFLKVANKILREGQQKTFEDLNLGHLENQSPRFVFIGLAKVICPPGGDLDRSIARDSYLEAIASTVFLNDIDNINQLQEEHIYQITTDFIVNTITLRIRCDISNKLEIYAISEETAIEVEESLGNFISGAVSDGLYKVLGEDNVLEGEKTMQMIKNIYTAAFGLLERKASEK